MSKAVRIREHLYAEIEKLAKEERRSLISQLEVLLEQALRMQDGGRAVQGPGESGDPSQSRQTHGSESVRSGAGSPGTDVKTDFK
jgi:hypothetical protein